MPEKNLELTVHLWRLMVRLLVPDDLPKIAQIDGCPHSWTDVEIIPFRGGGFEPAICQ
ncbi:hypothetical protein ABID26_006587 [Mesorhizobium shonense]|uniref:Uncharacterized protein n=1 Tax=Mesorhizobium shonense TaxID=1209948 RepID=A0ABV2I2T5_9HYPH